MKANKVLKLLGITRRTLTNYVNSGKIRVERMDNGFYKYDDSDVFRLANENNDMNCIIIYLNGDRKVYELSDEKICQIMRISEVI